MKLAAFDGGGKLDCGVKPSVGEEPPDVAALLGRLARDRVDGRQHSALDALGAERDDAGEHDYRLKQEHGADDALETLSRRKRRRGVFGLQGIRETQRLYAAEVPQEKLDDEDGERPDGRKRAEVDGYALEEPVRDTSAAPRPEPKRLRARELRERDYAKRRKCRAVDVGEMLFVVCRTADELELYDDRKDRARENQRRAGRRDSGKQRLNVENRHFERVVAPCPVKGRETVEA